MVHSVRIISVLYSPTHQANPQFSETSLVHITAVYVSLMKKLPSKNKVEPAASKEDEKAVVDDKADSRREKPVRDDKPVRDEEVKTDDRRSKEKSEREERSDKHRDSTDRYKDKESDVVRYWVIVALKCVGDVDSLLRLNT